MKTYYTFCCKLSLPIHNYQKKWTIRMSTGIYNIVMALMAASRQLENMSNHVLRCLRVLIYYNFREIYFNTPLIHQLKCNRCPPPVWILDFAVASPSGNKKQNKLFCTVFQHMDTFYLPVTFFPVSHLDNFSDTRNLKLWDFSATRPRKSYVSHWLMLALWLTVRIFWTRYRTFWQFEVDNQCLHISS